MVIDALTFRIKESETQYTDHKIFVYGTEIDDFHTLSKDYIYTLNVCATQEGITPQDKITRRPHQGIRGKDDTDIKLYLLIVNGR